MSDPSPQRPRVALFGGAFDPPHIGHLEFCRALAGDRCFDEVWVLPTSRHPFGKGMAPFEHRIAMCRAAFAALGPKVRIRDDEERLGGEGFTIDLVAHLRSRYPHHSFTLALGSDNYGQRHNWKDFRELGKLVEVRFFGRRGFERETVELGIDAPFPEATSAEIRERIAAGDLPADLMPPAVAEYIEEHGLYR